MKKLRFALNAAAGLLTLLLSTHAVAALDCSGGTTVFAGGNGGVLMSQVNNAPVCVQVQDKLFGNFVFGSTFTDPLSNVIFTLNSVAGQERHQVAFNTPYLSGSDYTISYEVEVVATSPLVIVELDADFTQTIGGPSRLVKNSVPLGNPAAGIDQIKTGTLSAGNTLITYSPGQRSLVISETLNARGTVSSITNTVVQSGVTPTLSTAASAGGPIGTILNDFATLANGFNATGTITFRLYGPNNATCTGTPVFTSDPITVSGNGVYASTPGFTTTAAGVYRWIASYSGDAGNAPVAGACNDTNENATITTVTPGIVTTASAGGLVGTVLTDQATLSGGVNPTGSITFRLYGPNNATCTGTPVFTSNAIAVSGNGSYTSAPGFTPTAAGVYRWIASYSGDAANAAVAGACNAANESATITAVTPAIATTASAGGPAGTALTDQATLSGGFNPTGSITFRLYGPNDATCAGAPVFTSNAIAVSGNGTYTSAPGYTATAVGTYRWIASYSGDAANVAVAGACNDANENVTITTATPALVTTASAGGPIGTVLTDQAALSGAANPTGSITFRLYGPNDASCTGAPVFTSNAIAVSGNGTYTSAPGYTATALGTYRWIASYSGDANNAAIPGACNGANESATITPPTTVQQIPTLSQWMLVALGLLLASFGLVGVRRRMS